MKLIAFGTLALMLLVSASAQNDTNPTCPQDTSFQPPAVRTLTFCASYFNQTVCCNATSTAALDLNFQSKLVPQYGTSNCYENLKNLFCTWLCNTRQAEWTRWNIASVSPRIFNYTISVAPALAQGIYDSCKRRCLAGTIPVFAIFPTVSEFISQFAVPSPFLPGVVPSPEVPYTKLTTAPGPAGASAYIDGTYFTALPLSNDDIQTDNVKCLGSTTTTTGASGSAPSLAAPFALLLGSALAAIALF